MMCSSNYPLNPYRKLIMNIISKIAKAELRNLFYSPIAWVVLVSFFIIISVRYVFMQELLVNGDPRRGIPPGALGKALAAGTPPPALSKCEYPDCECIFRKGVRECQAQ